jgi:hypothetical protein
MGRFIQARRSNAEMSDTPKMKQNVEHVAPPADVLEDFAHQICQRLGDEFAEPEIERGFANFLILISLYLPKTGGSRQPAR